MELGLTENDHVQYITIPSFGGNGGGWNIMQAYLRRAVCAAGLVRTFDVGAEDIIICHNEFIPNSIPMRVLSRRSPSVRKIYWFHMLAPRLWRGYQGEFTGTIHWPGIRLLRYRLDQWIYRKSIPSDGIILSNNPWYRRTLEKWFPKNRIHILDRYSGAAVSPFDGEKKYDVAWCGRIHPQKGLADLVDVVCRLKQHKPDVKLILIGSGEKRNEQDLDRRIDLAGLQGNIIRAGYLEGDEKFRTLQQARVFVMPSWFESFGQVNLEAMKCGLPVVAYDLPVYGVFKKGMVKVPVRDNVHMVDEILRLLDDSKMYEAQRAEALEFSAEFSWEKTGEETLGLIQSL